MYAFTTLTYGEIVAPRAWKSRDASRSIRCVAGKRALLRGPPSDSTQIRGSPVPQRSREGSYTRRAIWPMIGVYGVPVAKPNRAPKRYRLPRQDPTTSRSCRRSCPGDQRSPSRERQLSPYEYASHPLHPRSAGLTRARRSAPYERPFPTRNSSPRRCGLSDALTSRRRSYRLTYPSIRSDATSPTRRSAPAT